MGQPKAERRWVRTAARWAIILAACWLLARSAREASGRELLDRLATTGPWALLVLVPGLLSVLAQTAGWRLLLAPMGLRPGWGALVRVRLAAEALFISAPGGGAVADGASVLLLGREAGISPAPALAAVAARKLALVLANGLLALIVLVGAFGTVVGASRQLGLGTALPWIVAGAGLVLGGGALGARALAGRGTVAGAVGRALERIPLSALQSWIAKHARALASVDERLAQIGSSPPGPFFVATGAYLLGWLAEMSETWLLLWLLGTPASFLDVVALDVLVSLLRSAAFVVPGGLGVQDAAYVSLLRAMALGNPTVGFALVVLKRGRDLVWTAVGLLVLARSASRGRQA